MPKTFALSRRMRFRVAYSMARAVALGIQAAGVGAMLLGAALLWRRPDGWGGIVAFAGFAALIYASLLIKASRPH